MDIYRGFADVTVTVPTGAAAYPSNPADVARGEMEFFLPGVPAPAGNATEPAPAAIQEHEAPAFSALGTAVVAVAVAVLRRRGSGPNP